VATEQVVGLVHRCVDSGADEVVLADTIGVGVPADVHRLFAAVRERHDVPLRFHFHNTRNTGYANAWTAAELGAVALDASSGGIGGCPFAPAATGNIATEDLAWMLARSGVETGVALDELLSASSHIEAKLGRPVPALLGRAGPFPRG
jgi:hydroxymethylglutaryl-CoA lyase